VYQLSFALLPLISHCWFLNIAFVSEINFVTNLTLHGLHGCFIFRLIVPNEGFSFVYQYIPATFVKSINSSIK
jgi:hypothetical protein